MFKKVWICSLKFHFETNYNYCVCPALPVIVSEAAKTDILQESLFVKYTNIYSS